MDMTGDVKLLSIYLNDHLAGATVGRELAGRAAGANRGNGFGEFLERLRAEIVEDRAALIGVIDALGGKRDPLKAVGGLAAERIGRLKLNGSLRSYSPLSRLVELEALLAGVDAKRSLWNVLLELELLELAAFDFDTLAMRASDQHAALSERRQEAAQIAF